MCSCVCVCPCLSLCFGVQVRGWLGPSDFPGDRIAGSCEPPGVRNSEPPLQGQPPFFFRLNHIWLQANIGYFSCHRDQTADKLSLRTEGFVQAYVWGDSVHHGWGRLCRGSRGSWAHRVCSHVGRDGCGFTACFLLFPFKNFSLPLSLV